MQTHLASAFVKTKEIAANALGAAAEKLGKHDSLHGTHSTGLGRQDPQQAMYNGDDDPFNRILEDKVAKYRKDRRDLLLYVLHSKSVASTVVLPAGASSLREVDLDRLSVPYIVSCAVAGKEINLDVAITRSLNADEDDVAVAFDEQLEQMETASKASEESSATGIGIGMGTTGRSPLSDADTFGAASSSERCAQDRRSSHARAEGSQAEERRDRRGSRGDANGVPGAHQEGRGDEEGRARESRFSEEGRASRRRRDGSEGDGVPERESWGGASVTEGRGSTVGDSRQLLEVYLQGAAGPIANVPVAFRPMISSSGKAFKPSTELSDFDLNTLSYDYILATAMASGLVRVSQGQVGAEKPKKGGSKLMARLMKSKSSKGARVEAASEAAAELDRVATLLELFRTGSNVSDAEDEQARCALGLVLSGGSGAGKLKIGSKEKRQAESVGLGRKPSILIPLDMLVVMRGVKFDTPGEVKRFALPKLSALRDLLLGSSVSGDLSSLGPVNQFLDAMEDATQNGDAVMVSKHAEMLSQGLKAGSWESELQSGRKGNASYGGAILYQALSCTLEVAKEWLAAEDCEEGEEEQIKELLDMIGAAKGTLGVTEAVYEALLCNVMLQLLPTSPDAWVAATSKPQELAKEKYMQEVYVGLQRLASALPSNSRQSTLSLLERLVEEVKASLDTLCADMLRLWPQGPGSLPCQRALLSSLLASLILHTIYCQTGKAGTGATFIAPDSLSDTSCPPVRALRLHFLLHAVHQGYTKAGEVAAAECEDQKRQVAARVQWAKSVAEQVVSSQKNALHFPTRSEQSATVSLLHDLVAPQMKEYLAQMKELSSESRQVLQNAGILTATVYNLRRADEKKGTTMSLPKFRPLNVEESLARVFPSWVSEQQEKLFTWVSRELDNETWKPVSEHKCYATSGLEVFRYIDATFEHFFAMDLPLNLELFSNLTGALDSVLVLYFNKMSQEVGAKLDFAVAAPPLTRYKEEEVERIIRKGTVRSSWGVKGKKAGKGPVLSAAGLPPRGEGLSPQRLQQINNLTVTNLCVRINTCQFAVDTLAETAKLVHERWNKMALSKKDRYPELSERLSAESIIFPQSTRVAAEARIWMIEFLAAKAVWWDLRDVLLEDLYRYSVHQSRLELVIVPLNTILEELVDVLEESLRNIVIEAIMHALLEGILRVLLDGGPLRVFGEKDAEMLDEDLHQLKEFFIVDGNGLPADVVNGAVAPVQEILNYYALETHVVIKDYEETFRRRAPTTDTDVTGLGLCPKGSDILLRVLCHRADREASKFLKTVYNLPKH